MTREEITDELRQCMKERGVYDESLEPAMRILATQMHAYQVAATEVEAEMVIAETSREDDLRRRVNPAFTVMSTLGEQIRKYMRDLGLVVAKPAGYVSKEKDTAPKSGDRLTSLMEAITEPKAKVYKAPGN